MTVREFGTERFFARKGDRRPERVSNRQTE
jgi:hypothetical protein